MSSRENSKDPPAPKQFEEVMVACKVCLEEVPVSEAKSEEASDYVAHFCGLDCYEKWLKSSEK